MIWYLFHFQTAYECQCLNFLLPKLKILAFLHRYIYQIKLQSTLITIKQSCHMKYLNIRQNFTLYQFGFLQLRYCCHKNKQIFTLPLMCLKHDGHRKFYLIKCRISKAANKCRNLTMCTSERIQVLSPKNADIS